MKSSSEIETRPILKSVTITMTGEEARIIGAFIIQLTQGEIAESMSYNLDNDTVKETYMTVGKLSGAIETELIKFQKSR